MIIIDKYAYTNALRNKNPIHKMGISFFLLAVALFFPKIYVLISIFLIATVLTVCFAKIPFIQYLKMLMIPAGFLLLSILAVLFSIGGNSDLFVYKLSFFGVSVGVLKEGIDMSLTLFLRSLACISAVYFLTLSTPMDQQIRVMKKLKFPKNFIELFALIYRFIFIFLEESAEIYRAQETRLGYKDMKTSFKSLSMLIRLLFGRVLMRYDEMNIALESKIFQGEFHL